MLTIEEGTKQYIEDLHFGHLSIEEKLSIGHCRGFTIKPDDIDVNKHFWNAFGNNETEVSARYIVKLCQQNGGWIPFTEEEIEKFYQKFGYKNFWFNRLVKCGFIIFGEDKKYYITIDFVKRCFKSSPADKGKIYYQEDFEKLSFGC